MSASISSISSRLVILAAALIPSGAYFMSHAGAQPSVTVTNSVLVKQVQRMGINLGTWTSWGAEQLAANVLKNPGFEGNIDRAIVIVKQASPGMFTDDQNWLGRPDGFWTGASYDVRSGAHAGQTGMIAGSRTSDGSGFPCYASQDGLLLAPGDVVALTRADHNDLPADWWFSTSAGASYAAELTQTRPGSPGVRSLRLSSTGGALAQADSYLDALAQRAGKLLPLQGQWKLSFWARLDNGNAVLRIFLKRDGTDPFLAETIPVSSSWKFFEFSLKPDDRGLAGTLDLRFEVQGVPSGDVLLDDAELRRTSDNTEFRSEVQTVLHHLRPAYLRDWEGQLGDTFENRVAAPFARRTSRYRPGDASQADYAYGLSDFLDLSARIGASPWIIAPTTFSDGECAQLGSFLADRQSAFHFPEIVVEFGNENWNLLFRPAGIPQAVAHGQAADRCLGAIRRNGGDIPLRTVINAQHANPSAAIEFAAASRESDIVSLAPYFLTDLQTGVPIDQVLPLLFAGDGGRLHAIASSALELQKETAVYEVNLHTDGGTATDGERTPVTSGVSSAAAVAVTMLDALASGVRRQCSYVLAGFDNQSAAPNGFVRLWGVTRDLATSNHLRPTGLGLAMINSAIQGDLMKTDSADASIRSYGFREHRHWTLVLASTSADEKAVQVRFPADGELPNQARTLTGDSPLATNEDGEHVTVRESVLQFTGRSTEVTVPAYGLVVLVRDAP